MERRARINNLIAKDLFSLHGSNAHTCLTGEEGDMSALCPFDWYEWCYFRDQTEKFPFNREVLGRCLGPATGAGNEMSQWILKSNGNVVPRRTSRPLRVEEKHNSNEAQKRKTFDALIERRWGTAITHPKVIKSDDDIPWEEYHDENEDPRLIPDVEDIVDATGKLLRQQPEYDRIIKSEVLIH